MKKERTDFCVECRRETPYEVRRVKCTHRIREKEYEFEITKAFCKLCGAEMILPGMMDKRAKDIDRQYREVENIVSISDIENLMQLYNIGKAPLSLALGFGEITVTRYLQGQVPSKEYSDIIKEALQNPQYMIDRISENRDKIGENAYKKALKAADEIKRIFCVSKKMLSVISYVFEKMDEITPLALQKILYYIQGIYMVLFDKPLYKEDCEAWVHGPVYVSVYEMFKNFKYSPIDDNRFALLKDSFKKLKPEEKEVIELVVETFGMYSGKFLEKITHREDPWKNAREGYLPLEHSDVLIEKDMIKKYFESIAKEYNIKNPNEIRRYINKKIEAMVN